MSNTDKPEPLDDQIKVQRAFLRKVDVYLSIPTEQAKAEIQAELTRHLAPPTPILNYGRGTGAGPVKWVDPRGAAAPPDPEAAPPGPAPTRPPLPQSPPVTTTGSGD